MDLWIDYSRTTAGWLLTTEPHNELHLWSDLVFTEVVC